jgi:hypothetical protein
MGKHERIYNADEKECWLSFFLQRLVISFWIKSKNVFSFFQVKKVKMLIKLETSYLNSLHLYLNIHIF